jgi:hypothetical protein
VLNLKKSDLAFLLLAANLGLSIFWVYTFTLMLTGQGTVQLIEDNLYILVGETVMSGVICAFDLSWLLAMYRRIICEPSSHDPKKSVAK